MSQILIEVDGRSEPVNGLWVHFQETKRAPAVEYRIKVPTEYLQEIFDPTSVTGPNKPMLEYINELVADLGPFIVEGYIKNIAKLMGVETNSYRWVIATLDSISEVTDGIELVGKALHFDPSLY